MARPTPDSALSAPRFLRDLVLVLGAVGLAVFAVTRWVAMPWVVEGASMSPTLRDRDRVIVAVGSYGRRPPRLGEIVLVTAPDGAPLVKRVAAPPPEESGAAGTVWVLGDNPGESLDSRSFGPLPVRQVRGRVVWRYWPVSAWGSIE